MLFSQLSFIPPITHINKKDIIIIKNIIPLLVKIPAEKFNDPDFVEELSNQIFKEMGNNSQPKKEEETTHSDIKNSNVHKKNKYLLSLEDINKLELFPEPFHQVASLFLQ